MSLADMYEKIAAIDEEQAEEMNEIEKVAAEYDAAGRIMARGFMDELDKLAQMPAAGPSPRMLEMAAKAKKQQMARQPKAPKVYRPAAPKGEVSFDPKKVKVGR